MLPSTFARKTAEIAAEAATGGTGFSLHQTCPRALDPAAVDLHVRPVYHRLADRVRAHVFLCMLAYYLEWYMRQHLAPMLFDDTHKRPPKH